jgi:predicted GNAT family N-acyltransferase
MPDASSAPVIRVAAPADLPAAFAVRRAVFIEEQGVSEEEEWDEWDATAVHLLATAPDHAPLGTARLLHGPAVLAKSGPPGGGMLGRLAVLKESRGTGLGRDLVLAVEAEARRRSLSAIELHAQTHAVSFYERLGYQPFGPLFDDAGIPHRAMLRTL